MNSKKTKKTKTKTKVDKIIEEKNKADEKKAKEDSAKGEEFKAAIEVAEKDYAAISLKLREDNSDSKALAVADQILQHVKSLYDDSKLPYVYEVRVCDLYEKIKNDIEALDYVKRLGTTLKTRHETKKKNNTTHNAWRTVGENQRKRRQRELEPLLSALERGDRITRSKSVKRMRHAVQLKQVAVQMRAGQEVKPRSPKDVFDFKDDDSPAKKKNKATRKTRKTKTTAKKASTKKASTKKASRNVTTKTPTRKATTTNTPTRKTRKTTAKKTTAKKTTAKKTTAKKTVTKTATKKTATKNTKPRKSNKAGRKRAIKSTPKRETRDERRKRKQNEVIEQASIFDFGDVEDPYA